jgi:hypothetical protein
MTTSRKPSRKSNITAFMEQDHNKEATSAGENEDLSGTFAPLQNHSSQAQQSFGFGNASFFNRIGGMDGIMSGMSNIQKIYSAYKLIQPMFSLLGSFGPALQIKSVQHQRKRQAAAAGKGRKGTARGKQKS